MPNILELSFHGELDLSNKRSIEEKLEHVEDGYADSVAILDLTNVLYLDTTFLTALSRARNHLHTKRPESSICIAARQNSITSRLFRITDLDQIYQMFDDMVAARRYAHSIVDQKAWVVEDVRHSQVAHRYRRAAAQAECSDV